MVAHNGLSVRPWYTTDMEIKPNAPPPEKTELVHMHFQRDLVVFILTVFVAMSLWATGILGRVLEKTEEWSFVGAFIAGMGYSSGLTSAVATVALFVLAKSHNVLLIASIGAIGAMVTDMLILRFFRDGLVGDFEYVAARHQNSRIITFLNAPIVRYLVPFVASLVIASPLPDEIGLAMFAAIKMRVKNFLPISFALNFLGIVIIALLAKTA